MPNCSLLRRNEKCIHLIYGIDQSINAANCLYFIPINYMLSLKKFTPETKLKLNEVFTQEMIQLHLGQAWDLQWHDAKKMNRTYPGEEQFVQMVANKTGGLFRMASRLIAVVLDLTPAQTKILTRFAETIGVCFQIQDDILNVDISNETYQKSKGMYGEDIYEVRGTRSPAYSSFLAMAG